MDSNKPTSTKPSTEELKELAEQVKRVEIKEEKEETDDREKETITRNISEKGISTELIEFCNLPINANTKKSIEKMGFKKMTPIQAKSILPLLEGRDLLGIAGTCSGKTLAYLIPTIEILVKSNFKPSDGTGVLIILPTRQIALQLYDIVKEIMKYHTQTNGILIGGSSKKLEEVCLNRGVNLLVSTPGRLLDHLQGTEGFIINNLKCLIIDEIDHILEIGFKEELNQIIKLLPKIRQTILFSAKQTQYVDDIAKVSLKESTMYIDDNL